MKERSLYSEKWGRFYLFYSVLFLICLPLTPCRGAEWSVTPTVEVTEEYNDNILYDPKDTARDDFITYITPMLRANYDTDQIRSLLAISASSESYADNDELDTIDFGSKLTLSYDVSRTLGLRVGGNYREDTTLETELLEEGLLARREDRRQYRGNLGADFRFSTRVQLLTDWSRGYTKYPDNPSDYDDRKSDTFALRPQYVLSPKTTLRLNLSYTETEYDRPGDPSIRNYQIGPSFRHDFAKDFYINSGAGYRYTEDRIRTGDGDKNYDGFIVNLSFHRPWKKGIIELLLDRDQYSTIDERSVERDRIRLRGTYGITERLSTALDMSYRQNRDDSEADDVDYYTVGPSVSYALTRYIRITGSVEYSEYDYQAQKDRDVFTTSLTLAWTWPEMLSSR